MKKDRKEKIVDRVPSHKLSERKWFWPVMAIFVVGLIGLIILFAWLLSLAAPGEDPHAGHGHAIMLLITNWLGL